MTITSSPPIRTSPTVIDRRLRLERPARELVRLGDAQHLVDAVEHLDQPLVGMPLADGAEHGARHAGRPVHVHAHLDEARDDLFDLRLGGPFFHYYDHGFCLPPVTGVPDRIRPVTCYFAVVLAVNHPPLEPPRFVDDPLEQPRDRVGAERAFRRDAAHVREHLLLALGLIDLDARAPSSAGRSRTRRARARSAGGRALRPRGRCRCANRQAWASERRVLPFSHRT